MHLAVSRNEKWLFSCGIKDKIVKWDIKTYEVLGTIPKENYGSLRIIFSEKLNLLFSTGQDTMVHAWNGTTCIEEYRLKGHNFGILCIDINQNSTRLFTGSDDHKIKVWDLDARIEKMELVGHTDCVKSMKSVDGGRYLISISLSDMVLWSLVSEVLIYRVKYGCQRFLALNPNDDFEVSYSHLNRLIRFDARRSIFKDKNNSLKFWIFRKFLKAKEGTRTKLLPYLRNYVFLP